MIRFRIGQGWRRERSAPVDGFGLELDGINLLSGAGEEPLTRVVPDLVEAVHSLYARAQPVAQASLPEAHLELVFLRDVDLVELSLVSLGRPARQIRPPLRLDLEELAAATARCARTLLDDLDAAAPTALSAPLRKRLVQRVEALETGEPEEQDRTSAGGWSYEQFTRAPGDFGFRLVDPRDRLLTFDRKAEAPLASLLVDGRVTLRLSATQLWTEEAQPFLFALELSRQSGELAHALEVHDPVFRFRPGGLGPELTVELRANTVDGHPLPATALARGMVGLSMGIAAAAASRNKTQAKNPYLQELMARSREVLAHLQPARASTQGSASPSRPRRGSETQPLPLPGRVRRLRFEPRWQKQSLGGEGEARLLLTPHGPVVSGPELAAGFGPMGELRFRHLSARGVAFAADEAILVAEPHRVACFEGAGPEARWVRSHDGMPLGPELIRQEGVLLAPSEGRAVVAFSELTGRELWRSMPARTQRTFLKVQAHRVLVATDAGHLYGLELADGQIKYRLRAPLPFQQQPISWGRRLLAVLGRGSHHALFVVDAHSGEVAWEQDLNLARPSAPLITGSRAYVAGERDGEGVLLCYGAAGRPVWERSLHLGPGRYALKAVGRSIVVVSQTGAATLLSPEGTVEWHLGAAGEAIFRPLPAIAARGVLVIPGERVRAVDPRGGQVLAEVEASPGLCDLKADARLNLYLLEESGELKAFRLTTQLAVVEGR